MENIEVRNMGEKRGKVEIITTLTVYLITAKNLSFTFLTIM